MDSKIPNCSATLQFKCVFVLFDGPSDVMFDNKGVANKTTLPQSILGKKQKTVIYHVVREVAEAGILRVGNKYTETNFYDPLTNILVWKIHHKLLPFILYSS